MKRRLDDSAGLFYGGDYNPEQWPEAVWPEDVRLMHQAGVNFVSVGIFSWARLQPDADRFDFAWLDRLLDLLAKNAIKVCLATATASPPPWLTHAHPEVLPVTAEGVTLFPGSRQHYSPSSPVYRQLAAQLVRRLAVRYGGHPALAAWHINNEYACHLPECHSEVSTRAFRAWLKLRYKTLDALNAAWGTAFWSQIYSDWEEIFTPRRAPYHSNPTQTLDFRRFTSDAFLECYRGEARILRELTPEIPITTNFMGFFRPLDYQRWAPELDFTAWDSYPDPLDEAEGRHWAAIGHDLTRSLKPGRPWVLMEQANSAVNWRPINRPKRPGLMRLHSWQAVARGADAVLFFQWRASRAGAEKFHSGLIPHVPATASRTFREVCELGQELRQAKAIAGTLPPPARIALIFDWNNWWACELESKPGRTDCVAWVRRLHRWFYERNYAVDFVAPDAPLEGYALVIAPMLYLLKQDDARNLHRFVQQGGHLLVTWFSGIVDENEHIVLGGYPGWLRETLGLWVEEWVPYPAGQGNRVTWRGRRGGFNCHTWADLLHLEEAEALAFYASDFFAGRPAFTRHAVGAGVAYYLGTEPDSHGLEHVLGMISAKAAVRPVFAAPDGVEATVREGPSARFLFLLNHRDVPITVTNEQLRGHDLLRGGRVKRKLRLEALGVAVVALDALSQGSRERIVKSRKRR